MPSSVQIIPIADLPEIKKGDNLGALIIDAARRQGTPLKDGDVLVVTQKVVSKAEGRVVDLATVTPSPLAVMPSSKTTWGLIGGAHFLVPAAHVEVISQRGDRFRALTSGEHSAEGVPPANPCRSR